MFSFIKISNFSNEQKEKIQNSLIDNYILKYSHLSKSKEHDELKEELNKISLYQFKGDGYILTSNLKEKMEGSDIYIEITFNALEDGVLISELGQVNINTGLNIIINKYRISLLRLGNC
jgi:hypothetical protein